MTDLDRKASVKSQKNIELTKKIEDIKLELLNKETILRDDN
jgi:hypothetical protein